MKCPKCGGKYFKYLREGLVSLKATCEKCGKHFEVGTAHQRKED